MLQAIAIFVAAIAAMGGRYSFGLPSSHAYLPITSAAATLIEQKFKIRIEPGLYFTDPWEAKLIPELRLKKLEEEVGNIDLTYLRDDEVVSDLYRGDAWHGTDAELNARVGWIQRADGVSKKRQLWLEKPNKERWLLYEHASDAFPRSGRSPSRILGLPRYFLRVSDGIVAFSPSWIMWRQVTGGTLLNEFEFQSPGEESARMQLRVIARQFETPAGVKEIPLVHYSHRNSKLLAAVWPQLPSGDVVGEAPLEADIVALNLQTNRAQKVVSALSWPYLLDTSGIWHLKKDPVRRTDQLLYYPLNWGSLKVAKARVVYETTAAKGTFHFRADKLWYSEKGGGDYVFTSEGTKVPLKVPEEDFISLRDPSMLEALSKFDQLPVKARDLLHPLRVGVDEPRSFDLGLNSQLAIVLGQTGRSWANVVYEDGQFAEDSIRSFLWGVDAGYVEASPSLKNLDAAFAFNAVELFSKKSDADLRDMLDRIRKVVDGTRSLLVLVDFPVRDPQQAASQDAQKHLQFFAGVFERCLRAGTCRVLTTMRREVQEALAKVHPQALAQGETVNHPDLADDMRFAVARILSIPHQERTGIVFNQAGFQRAMQWCETEYAETQGVKLASPGYEAEFIRRLFRQAEAEKRRFPDENLTEIGSEFIRRLEAGFSSAPAAVQALRRMDFEKLNRYLKRNTAGRTHHRVIDQITDALETQLEGTRPANVGPPAFVLVGNSGVGKSHIALLVSQFFLAGGDEDRALLMGDDAAILFDMGFEAGATFKIDPKTIQGQRLKNAPMGSIVVFDDIQKAERKSSIAVIGQILDKGYYARGTAEQINFNKVGAVFLTTTWGSHLLQQGRAHDGTFEENLRKFLIEDANGPQIDEGLWGRLSSHMFLLPDLQDWDLLEAAFIYSRNLSRRYQIRENIQVRVDPSIFIGILDEARERKGQGRDMVKGIINAFPVAAKQMRTEGVGRILLTKNQAGRFIAKTDLDADFKTRWDAVERTYAAYEQNGIDSYLETLKTSSRADLAGMYAKKKADEENSEDN